MSDTALEPGLGNYDKSVLYDQQVQVGTLGLQSILKIGQRQGLADEVFGARQWQLLTIDGPLDPLDLFRVPSRAIWSTLKGACLNVGAEGVDVEGDYALWFKDLNAKAIIIRPDFYIYVSKRRFILTSTEYSLGLC